MGLLAVPRALLAQRAGELVEADVTVADGHAERGHVHARQVIRFHRPVELAPGRGGDRLAWRAEALEDDDRLVAAGVLDGQLDVRQHPLGMRVGDQHRTADAGRGGGELVPVDQPHTRLDGIDAEPRPRQVEERHRRQHDAVDALVGLQQAHRALEHERRSGHRVQHLAVLDRRGDERLGDRRVHVGEAIGGLVDVVERRRRRHQVGARVPGRAQVAVRDPLDRLQRLDGDVLVAARTEPDDDDPRSHPWTMSPMRASERQRASGQQLRRRHAWPGNAVTGRRRRSSAGPSARSAGRRRRRTSPGSRRTSARHPARRTVPPAARRSRRTAGAR